jgi:hypothetical protein
MSICLKLEQLEYLFMRLSLTESKTSMRMSLRKRMKGKYVMMQREKLLRKIYYSEGICFLLVVNYLGFYFSS